MTARIVVVSLAAIGSAVSGYLTWLHYSGGLALCAGVGGCEVVQASRYSMIGTVPVAALGLSGFVGLLGVALWWVRTDDERSFTALFALSLAATAFVAYLTYVELFVIGAVCPWCVAVAICAAGIFALCAREALRD